MVSSNISLEVSVGRYASLASSRIFSSTFNNDKSIVDLDISSKHARSVPTFALVSKFAVVALKDTSGGKNWPEHDEIEQ